MLRKPFLDGVLVRTGEGREYQVARIGVAWVNRQLSAVFRAAAHFVDVGEIQAGVDALGVQVHGQRHQADVAGAFAITEQTAFDAVGAGHHRQFGCRYSGAPVVMRVNTDDDTVAVPHIDMHPLDLVGIHIGGGGFNSGRQVEDDFVFRRGLPDIHDGVTHFQGEFGFRRAEHFG